MRYVLKEEAVLKLTLEQWLYHKAHRFNYPIKNQNFFKFPKALHMYSTLNNATYSPG